MVKAPASIRPDWKVDIDTFEGPLDLLLHLIKSKNLDIYDIPISQITSEYLEYISIIRHLNLDNVGEFVLMAAVLMRIKSKMLLPQIGTEEPGEESAEEMKQNLIERLIEYKKYKDAADKLFDRESAYENVFPLHQYPISELGEEVEATLFDLIDAFRELIQSSKESVKDIITEEITVEEKTLFILDYLKSSAEQKVDVRDLVENKNSILDLVVTLLSILELSKIKKVRISQASRFGRIIVELTSLNG